MRIAYLDCFSGMSGDMFLGALIDAGVPTAVFNEAVSALNIGAKLEVSRVNRSGISATKVDVYVHGEKELPREVYWEQQRHKHEREHAPEAKNENGGEDTGHGHAHAHSHAPVQLLEHNYSRADLHPDAEHHSHEHGRGLKEIRGIISQAAFSEGAKQRVIATFEALAVAEAKIHNTTTEQVHFHEIGAVDAIVDISCAALGTEALGIDEIICSPINVGGGTVKCAHGTFPIPAPATTELLKEVPVYSSGIQAELITPTGAAILKTLASRFGPFPQMKIENTGYGAGTRDFPGYPNVVRITVGESLAPFAGEVSPEMITVLEANIDDLNPQVFGYVMDRLLAAGALDAFGIPAQMKKNRPGMLLTVLSKPGDAIRLMEIMLSETTTLGVRRRDEMRQTLSRRCVTVSTQWGDVRLKVASLNGAVTNYAPEYEDCRRIAQERRVPLKEVMQQALLAFSKTKS